MEFDYIGNRCEVSTCKLQDFLPFSCDICKGTYCLSHRSYNTHNCEGQYIKDIYSIECPICHLTVKYDKSEDINDVWNTHYNINCNKVNNIKNNKKCYETTCRTILGLSNKFKCNKCNNEICLSHRAPEDHHCPGIITNNVSTKSVKKSNNSNINANSNNNYINSSINNKTTLKNEVFLSKFNTTSKNSSKSNKNSTKSTDNNNKKLKSTGSHPTSVEVYSQVNLFEDLIFIYLDMSNVLSSV